MTDPHSLPGNAVRVPIATPRFSLGRFVGTVFRFMTGEGAKPNPDAQPTAEPNAMTFAPLALRDSGASYVFDADGVRLEGYKRLPFAILWSETKQVRMQVERSQMLGLSSLQCLVWPADLEGFAAAHPQFSEFWDATVGAFSLTMQKAPTIDSQTIALAMAGARHAGHRFDGALGHRELPGG